MNTSDINIKDQEDDVIVDVDSMSIAPAISSVQVKFSNYLIICGKTMIKLYTLHDLILNSVMFYVNSHKKLMLHIDI